MVIIFFTKNKQKKVSKNDQFLIYFDQKMTILMIFNSNHQFLLQNRPLQEKIMIFYYKFDNFTYNCDISKQFIKFKNKIMKNTILMKLKKIRLSFK